MFNQVSTILMQKIQKFKFFYLLVLGFLIFQIFYCSEIVDSSYCCEGCSLCQNLSTNINNYTCIQCKNNFKLEESTNKCIFQLCSQNLFLQGLQTDQQKSDQCVALCQNSYFANKLTNMCEKLQECSQLLTSSNQLFIKTLVIEANQLSENKLIVQYKGVQTIIDIQSGLIIKTINIDDNIMIVTVIKGNVFLFDTLNKLYKWNVNLEQMQLIQEITKIPFSISNKFIEIGQRYVCAVIVDKDNNQIQFRIIFDISTQETIQSNNIQYQLIQDNSESVVYQNIIINQSDKIMKIQYISFKDKILIEQICLINKTNPIELTQSYDQNDIFLAIKVNKREILFINKEQKTCNQLNIKEIKDNINSIKVETLNNNYLLILKEENFISIFNVNSNSIQQLNLNLAEQENILDYQITHLQTKYSEIVILTNFNNIYTYTIDSLNNQNQFEKTQLQMINNMYIYKIQPIDQAYSSKLGIMISSSESLTILKRNTINQKIEQTALINYKMPYPAQLGKIKKIIIIETYSYLVQYTENGFIQIFDISSGYGAHLIKTINLSPDQCFDIQSILSEKIIAVLSTKIVIINLFTCIQDIKLEFDKNYTPSISVNGQYTSISLNGCIYLYENSKFERIFENCEQILQENILNISLSQDLILYLFSKGTIKSVQIDLSDQKNQKLKDLNNYPFSQQQLINYYEIIYLAVNQVSESEFYIDEILVFDQGQTLSILNKNLKLTHSLNIPKIKNPNMIKRAVNDSSFYVLIESYRDGGNVQYKEMAFMKKISLEIIWEYSNYNYSPMIYSPVKFLNEDGIEQYLIRQFIVFDTFSMIMDHIIQPSTQKSYNQGVGFGALTGITYSQVILNAQNFKTLTFVGSENGELIQYYRNNNIYQVIEISKYFKNQDDEIVQLINFQILEKYFVLFQSYILIFNVFTDGYETIIEFDPSNTINGKMSIIQSNIFIFSSQNYILLRLYETKQKYKDYTYTKQQLITEWLYDEKDNLFYVYGKGFNSLDNQLIIKKVILSSEYTLEKCLITQMNYICKVDETTLLIIDKSNNNKQNIQVKGFISNFYFNVDLQYSLLYLIENYVQVYTLDGIFSSMIYLKYGDLTSIDFYDDYMIILSNTVCVVLDRKSYVQITDFYTIFNIVKSVYASTIKSIILSTSNPQFSSIFVFDIPAKAMLGKISSMQPNNGIGTVVDFIYDGENTQVAFLDEFGNIQINMVYLSFEQQNNIKFIEMEQRNEKAIGFTINFSTNTIYAYSKKTLFKANYAQLNDVYLLSMTQNKGIFTIIKQNDNNNNQNLCLKYLTINENNAIFKYLDYQMIYQKAFDDEIIDISYFYKNQQIIIAFYNHLKVFDNYSYDLSYNWSKYKFTEEFLFEKFVDDDIFITFDKQIIHYDFKNMKILKSLQLDLKSKLTTHLILSTNEQIVFGFQNGSIILYFKNNLNQDKQKFVTVKNEQSNDFENKPIKFILEIDNSTLYVSNIEGQIIEYNMSSDKITNKYELLKFIKQQEKLLLSDIKYDKVYKRLLFIFIGQNGGYVWGLQESKILSYFSGGNIQKNSITLTNKYIIISSAFQLNFYELSGESKFIGMIYGSPWYDQIQNFRILENEIVIICSYEKFLIYYVGDMEIKLIERQEVQNPFILEYTYNLDSKHINVNFLSKQGISQVMINVQYFINDSIKTCYSEINSNETQLIQMQIQKIQQRKSFIIEYSIKMLAPSNDSEIFLNASVDSDYISFISNVLKKSQTQQQIVLSPINEVNNDYVLSQNSLTQLEQSKFYMKDFYFYVNEKETSDKFNNINFNSQTKYVIWQNITFVKNQIIKGVQINFVNLTEVILFDIKLSKQTLAFSENNNVLSKSNLLHFENVQRVFIYNLTIEHNDFSNSDYEAILFMKQVKEVYIQDVQINNNQGNINIMRFDLVSIIKVSNFKVYSNQYFDQNNQRKFLILICQGCLEIIASEIEFIENEQVQLIQTVNYYELDEGIMTYSKDSIKLINTTISQNNFTFEQIVSITQSYVSFTNLNYTLNVGNIKISDSKSITIQGSLFLNNQAYNGGALSVYNLKENLNLKKTSVIQNKALGSGGGIYFENIQTQIIEFSTDCKIQNNSALIGGGVRILNKSSKQIIPLQYPFIQTVEQNNAELYGDNTCTFLQNILIQNGNEDFDQTQNNTFQNLTNYQFNYQINDIKQKKILGQTGYLGYLQVFDFKSGGNLYLNIFFIDQNKKKLQFSQDKLKQKLYPDDIIEEIESLSIVFMQGNGNENSVILTGETILNKNLYNEICNCFQIKQLSISSLPSITKQLSIQFYTNKYTNQISQILVAIEFRKCKYGEVIQQTITNIQICNFCSDGTYSLIDPNTIQNITQDQVICKKCPDQALNCLGNIITLKNGYWRRDNNTDEILTCNPQINSCRSQDPNSREQGCSQGFVGPLCEVSDLEGSVWGQQYISTFDGNQCSECSNKLLQYTFFFLQGIGILLFMIFTSSKSFESIKYSQLCYYLRKTQFLPISRVQISSLTTSFIKIIISYLQFSSLVTSKESFLPSELNIMPNLFGSSNKMITLSIGCIIPVNLIKQFGKSFVLCIINFFLPLLYILFSLFIFEVFKDNFFPSRSQRKYLAFILLSVIYMFFLLDTVQFFTTMLTCRQIGSYSYNSVDLLQLCNEEKYTIFIKPFSVSVLAIWTLFPLVLILFLRKQKKSLNQCLKKFKYGYFYLELKNKYYYWEFVRILLKLLVVIVNTLLKQEYLVISRQIIILMFAQYIKLTTSIKPFQSSELQYMEILSIQLIIAKILLQTSKELIVQGKIVFEILIFLTDFSFIFYFIQNVSKYIINNSESLLGKIIQFILKRICSEQFYKRITRIKQTHFNTYMKWKKIKNNLQYLIKQQASQNMNNSPKVQQSQYPITTSRHNSVFYLLTPMSGTTRRLRNQNTQMSKDTDDLFCQN